MTFFRKNFKGFEKVDSPTFQQIRYYVNGNFSNTIKLLIRKVDVLKWKQVFQNVFVVAIGRVLEIVTDANIILFIGMVTNGRW